MTPQEKGGLTKRIATSARRVAEYREIMKNEWQIARDHMKYARKAFERGDFEGALNALDVAVHFRMLAKIWTRLMQSEERSGLRYAERRARV